MLDTTPHLLEQAATERLYYWLDIHFTVAGNRVVAEAAIPFLESVIREAESPEASDAYQSARSGSKAGVTAPGPSRFGRVASPTVARIAQRSSAGSP